MRAERCQKIEQLYHAALELQEVQRAAYLRQACAGDDALRQEVESLLAQQSRGEQFLETPALEVAARVMAEHQNRSLVGQRFGSSEVLGRGMPGAQSPNCIHFVRISNYS